MARKKIPGVYMIRIIPTGKIYIGQSNDVRQRFNRYKWLATSDKDYAKNPRPIVKAIQKYGLKNVQFIPLVYGDKYKDTDYRLLVEQYFIDEYDACNPDVGYNAVNEGYARGAVEGTKQSVKTKGKRAKPVFLYNIKTGGVMYYLGGSNAVGKHLGYSKDVMSHVVNRGDILEKKYYIFFALPEDRKRIYEKLRKQRTENFDMALRARNRSANNFERYKKAYKEIHKIAKEYGFSG